MAIAHPKSWQSHPLPPRPLQNDSPNNNYSTLLAVANLHTKPICLSPIHKRHVSLRPALTMVRSGCKNVFPRRTRTSWLCQSSSLGEGGEVGAVGDRVRDANCVVGEGQFGYLVNEHGWAVRRLVEEELEMRKVAYVQAQAFHVTLSLFNDFFFQFFQAEILAALLYKLRNSPPNRYACLVAESADTSNPLNASEEGIVGVVDATVQRDGAVLKHLDIAEEYLFVSGIAVLKDFRRRKVATMLLKACDELSLLWGLNYLALWAYEDDSAANNLYASAGYEVVSADPLWMTTWVGRKRRVLLIKQSGG